MRGAPLRPTRRLTPSLFGSAAQLLAEAFFTNPAHTYICPDASERFAQLEWLLGSNLRLQCDLETSFCLADGDVVDAMGFWTRSTREKPGALRQIQAGLLRAPFRLGWSGLRRAFEVTHAIERQLERALGGQAFWTLNNMVVRERLRGSGVGSTLLREQLQLVRERDRGCDVALSTQRPENVQFYERLGFRTVLTETLGRGPGSFQSWILLHGGEAHA